MAHDCCDDGRHPPKATQSVPDYEFTTDNLISNLTFAETLHNFVNHPPNSIYKATFVVSSLNPQLRLKLADHYYLHDENDNVEYEKLTLEQKRYARRVVNEEITVVMALSDIADEMVEELAYGDKVEIIYQLKSIKQFTQKALDENCYPSEINIVDLKIIERYSILNLAYYTVFDPLLYILIAVAFSSFIVLSGWYNMGFVWRWGLGGILITIGLLYWLYVQTKEFFESYRCLKRDIRVHGDSKFFSDKKTH